MEQIDVSVQLNYSSLDEIRLMKKLHQRFKNQTYKITTQLPLKKITTLLLFKQINYRLITHK